jgi:hypothetical protein
MSEPLLPKRFLFRFSMPCRFRDPLWTPKGELLDDSFRLTSFAELEQRGGNADVRAAWSEAGIAFTVVVGGKRQPPWCRDSRVEDSDGVQFWIDTRDVHDVHRASRFCHRFFFLPTGGGQRLDQPVGVWMPIHRAKDDPRQIKPGMLKARSEVLRGGYRLDVLLPAEALTGYDPHEHPRLGFTYAVIDRELGEQTLGPGTPMPYQEDPSLWSTLELVRE